MAKNSMAYYVNQKRYSNNEDATKAIIENLESEGFRIEYIDTLKSSIMKQLSTMDDCDSDNISGDIKGTPFSVFVEAFSKESELDNMLGIEYEITLDGKVYTDDNEEAFPNGEYEIVEAHFNQGKAYASIKRIAQ